MVSFQNRLYLLLILYPRNTILFGPEFRWVNLSMDTLID